MTCNAYDDFVGTVTEVINTSGGQALQVALATDGRITMVVTLKEVLDSLPPERRAKIDRRYEELLNEVESLKELRSLSKLSH